jgi:glycosyltransferase involved in cell wall biosynthesis
MSTTPPPAGGDRKPLKVMLFDHTAQLGGGEIALLEMVGHFDRTRVTPIVVVASEGPLPDRMRKIAETHVLPLDPDVVQARKDDLGSGPSALFKQGAKSIAYTFRLSRFMRENRIDLVHTNSLKADILGGVAAKLARRPLIWHLRDRIEDDYLPRSVVRIFRVLARILPDFIIGNSKATLATLHLHGRVPVEDVASGVDLATFGPVGQAEAQDEAAPGATVDIGIIGRLCEWKGQHIFLRAAAAIAKDFPKARFKVIGAPLFGEESYAEEMRRLAQSLGIDNIVDFMGFRTDVRQLIGRLDLVVHASTTGEPLGQVILQGMAAGKPVIATNGGGVPEIMVDGVTGILVPMGDTVAMAAAMRTILASADTGRAMGRHGRRHVELGYTIGTTTRRIESIYAGVMRKTYASPD